MDDQEIMDVISLINEEISALTDDMDLYLNFSTNGFAGIISLGDFQLWCSEDDDREFNEETNSYEPLLGYLCKKIQDLSNTLIKISKTVKKH
jgi:hypothetical protein